MPDGLYEALLAKLPTSAHVMTVVEAAATIGRYVDRDLLRSVVSLADAAFDNAVRELQDVLIFEPWGADGWRFHHELMREVAVELAPPSVRRKLHAKVAECLSATGSVPTGIWLPHITSRLRVSPRPHTPKSLRRPVCRR